MIQKKKNKQSQKSLKSLINKDHEEDEQKYLTYTAKLLMNKNRVKLPFLIKNIKINLHKKYTTDKNIYFKKIIVDIINKAKCSLCIRYMEMLYHLDNTEYLKSFNNFTADFMILIIQVFENSLCEKLQIDTH